MKRKIHSVLRSRAGASLSFALLLFLVCSVVGMLVLTAGTTAAGRVSNMAQMDQRYYSVSSAADLLAEELSGKTVRITRTRTLKTVEETPYTISVVDLGGASRTVVTAGETVTSRSASYSTLIGDSAVPITSTIDLDNEANSGKPITSDISFLTARAVQLLFYNGGTGNLGICNTDEAMNASMKNGAEHSGTLVLRHSPSDAVSSADLEVECAYSVKKDGTIVLTLTNTNGDPYSLRMNLRPTIKVTQNETSSPETVRIDTDTGYIERVITTVELKKVSEITWTVSGMEKVVSTAVSEGGD